MLVSDVGDIYSSFDKLKETLNSGNLLLFWKESEKEQIWPILNFINEDKTLKRFIKTTSLDATDNSFVLLDWEILYKNKLIEQLYINWNPTIYSHWKTIHFMNITKPVFQGKVDVPAF